MKRQVYNKGISSILGDFLTIWDIDIIRMYGWFWVKWCHIMFGCRVKSFDITTQLCLQKISSSNVLVLWRLEYFSSAWLLHVVEKSAEALLIVLAKYMYHHLLHFWKFHNVCSSVYVETNIFFIVDVRSLEEELDMSRGARVCVCVCIKCFCYHSYMCIQLYSWLFV